MSKLRKKYKTYTKESQRGKNRQIERQASRPDTREKYATKKELAAKEIILKNSKDFNGSNTDAEVIKIAGSSRNSYYKYKAELKEAEEQ